MSSQVLSIKRAKTAEPLRFLTAMGHSVNAPPPQEGPANPDTRSASNADLESALHRILVLEARIQEIESQVPEAYEKGRRQGYLEGEKVGITNAKATWQQALDQLSRAITDLGTYRARFRRDSEQDILRLVIAIARKILHRELTVDPHSLLGVLKAALETINQAELLSIRISPEDQAAVATRVDSLGLPAGIEIRAERGLERGAILIETKRGSIDAGIQTQLSEIERGFTDRMKGAHSQK